MKVANLDRLAHAHEVLCPHSMWSTCTCKGGIRGLVCSHQMRAVMAAANHSSAKAAQRFTGNEVGLAAEAACTLGVVAELGVESRAIQSHLRLLQLQLV